MGLLGEEVVRCAAGVGHKECLSRELHSSTNGVFFNH